MKIQRQRETFSWRMARMYSDDEWNRHVQEVDAIHNRLRGLVRDNRTAYGNFTGGEYVVTDPRRKALHERVFDLLGRDNPGNRHRKDGSPVTLDEIPRDHLALLLAGISGAGKGSVLKNNVLNSKLDPRVRPERHFTINPDDTKMIMASLGMIPNREEIMKSYRVDPGEGWDALSPMEKSPFIHEEASWLTKEFAKKLRKGGHNIAYDQVMGDPQKAAELVRSLRKEGYGADHGGRINTLFVDTSPSIGIQRTFDRHRHGQLSFGEEFDHLPYGPQRYKFLGGRPVPTGAQKELSPPPGAPPDVKSAPGFTYRNVLRPLSDNAARIDGDTSSPDPDTMPNVIQAMGPEFSSLAPLALPPGRMGRRMTANEEAEIAQFLAEIESKIKESVRGIVEDFEEGKIDYPTLVSSIVQRREFVDHHPEPRPYFDVIVEDADNAHHWLGEAVEKGFLTQDQMDEIGDLISQMESGGSVYPEP